MRAGLKLNRKLVLEDGVDVADGAGGITRSWSALGTIWADIRRVGGREQEMQQLPVSSANCRITVRATPFGSPSRPRAGQRFVEGTRIYRIVSVSEVGPDQRFLVALAREETVQ